MTCQTAVCLQSLNVDEKINVDHQESVWEWKAKRTGRHLFFQAPEPFHISSRAAAAYAKHYAKHTRTSVPQSTAGPRTHTHLQPLLYVTHPAAGDKSHRASILQQQPGRLLDMLCMLFQLGGRRKANTEDLSAAVIYLLRHV